MMLRALLGTALCACIALTAPAAMAQADGFPSKPIRVSGLFAAGL